MIQWSLQSLMITLINEAETKTFEHSSSLVNNEDRVSKINEGRVAVSIAESRIGCNSYNIALMKATDEFAFLASSQISLDFPIVASNVRNWCLGQIY